MGVYIIYTYNRQNDEAVDDDDDDDDDDGSSSSVLEIGDGNLRLHRADRAGAR